MPIFKTCANAISSSSVELTLYVLVLCLHGRGGLEVECSTCMGEIEVRFPAMTD